MTKWVNLKCSAFVFLYKEFIPLETAAAAARVFVTFPNIDKWNLALFLNFIYKPLTDGSMTAVTGKQKHKNEACIFYNENSRSLYMIF